MSQRPTGAQLRADHEASLRWMPERTYEDYVKERIAPEGMQWVCLACGKTAVDRVYGGGGWDESCYLNSKLFAESWLVRKDGRVTQIEEPTSGVNSDGGKSNG